MVEKPSQNGKNNAAPNAYVPGRWNHTATDGMLNHAPIRQDKKRQTEVTSRIKQRISQT